jgi:APA family basic amino acid/polyamine antiporter
VGNFTETQIQRSTERKSLGFLTVVSLVISSQVGSGIFIFPADLAPFGTLGLLGWPIAVAGAIALALVFSELSSKIVKNGGPHVYIREAFGEKAGFFCAWIYWIISWASNSILLVTMTNYLSTMVGDLGPCPTVLIQTAVLFIIASINLMGVRTSGAIEICLTFLKVTPLFVLPLLFFTAFNPENFKISATTSLSTANTINIMTQAALLIFWGFIGIECATTPAGRIKNAQKTLPKAIIVGTSCVALIYIFNVISVFGVVGFDALIHSKAPYALAIGKIAPGFAVGDRLISLLAIIVCIGTLNAWTLSAGQIAQGASEDRLFPLILGKTNGRDAPVVAIFTDTLGIIPFLIAAQVFGNEGLDRLITFMASVFLIIYFSCAIAYVRMIKAWKNKTFDRIKAYVLALFAAAFCIFIIAQNLRNSFITLAVFILTGIPVYYWRNVRSL